MQLTHVRRKARTTVASPRAESHTPLPDYQRTAGVTQLATNIGTQAWGIEHTNTVLYSDAQVAVSTVIAILIHVCASWVSVFCCSYVPNFSVSATSATLSRHKSECALTCKWPPIICAESELLLNFESLLGSRSPKFFDSDSNSTYVFVFFSTPTLHSDSGKPFFWFCFPIPSSVLCLFRLLPSWLETQTSILL